MSAMRLRCLGLIFVLTGVFDQCGAQANAPTAQRATAIELGIGITGANPDYATSNDLGISGFVVADFSHHVGLELEYHNADLVTPHDVGEITYLAGVRYRITRGRFQPYVKALAGIGTVKLDQGYYQASQSPYNFLYGLGGGLEYQASRRIIVRAADFELQIWPGFAAHSLTPYLLTSGVAYRF